MLFACTPCISLLTFQPTMQEQLLLVQARPGDRVHVRVGGSFGYRPGDEARPLLFLAGGIGITPLLSVLRHCWQLTSQVQQLQLHGSCAGQQQQHTTSTGQRGQQSGSSLAQRGSSVGRQLPERQKEGRREGQLALLRATVLFSASVPGELALLGDLKQIQRDSAGGLACMRTPRGVLRCMPVLVLNQPDGSIP
jgi:hypothetical protein